MELRDTQIKYLRGVAHALNPVVTVGQQGLKPTVLEEIDKALEHHQLIKIKLALGNREARIDLLAQIMKHAPNATLIQQIGSMAVLYQRNPDKTDITRSAN